MMTNKRYRPLVIFILLFLVLIVIANLVMNSALKKSSSKDKSSAAVKPLSSSGPSEMSKNVLAPDNPLRYNIIEQRKEAPQNQKQWDDYMRRTLQQTRAMKQVSDPKVAATLTKSKAEIQAQLLGIEKLIKEAQAALKKDPLDVQAKQKLQDLYMLRSTLKTLAGKVVTDKKPSR